jgi:hypothetical protein
VTKVNKDTDRPTRSNGEILPISKPEDMLQVPILVKKYEQYTYQNECKEWSV